MASNMDDDAGALTTTLFEEAKAVENILDAPGYLQVALEASCARRSV